MADSTAPFDGSTEPTDPGTPEVVAHTGEGEETPWCGIHQEKDTGTNS